MLASTLFRRRIWRLDPGDPHPHPRHQCRRRHCHRRLRDEAAGQGRCRTRHLALFRTDRRYLRPDHAGPLDRAAVAHRPKLPPDLLFRARHSGFERDRIGLRRLTGERPDGRASRADDFGRRDRSGHRSEPLYVRQRRSSCPASLRSSSWWACLPSASCWRKAARPGGKRRRAPRRGSGSRGPPCGGASPDRRRSARSIGTFEGIMPGGGGTISAFLAYNEARRWSSHKEEFGNGSPEGIAAPEAANNTVACTALVPMLSLGITELELLGRSPRRVPDSRPHSRPDAVRETSRGHQRPVCRPVHGEHRDGDPRAT